jgi:UDP-glucose 4-epimerase
MPNMNGLVFLEHVKSNINIYNLGTGQGTSVLDLVETFKRVNKNDIHFEIKKRRQGDIAISYANVK